MRWCFQVRSWCYCYELWSVPQDRKKDSGKIGSLVEHCESWWSTFGHSVKEYTQQYFQSFAFKAFLTLWRWALERIIIVKTSPERCVNLWIWRMQTPRGGSSHFGQKKWKKMDNKNVLPSRDSLWRSWSRSTNTKLQYTAPKGPTYSTISHFIELICIFKKGQKK